MISLSKGLEISLIILEQLRNMEKLKDIDVFVGTFTNREECGLTFKIIKKDLSYFTFCVYEHGNSDEIIINGIDGYITACGKLPYKSDNRWDYIAKFDYNQFLEAAEKLEELIIEKYNEKSKEGKNEI